MAIPPLSLTNCDVASGIRKIFLIEAVFLQSVVFDVTETDSIADFTRVTPATNKFKPLNLAGLHAVLTKEAAGGKKSNGMLKVLGKRPLNTLDAGIKWLRSLNESCGLAAVIFLNSGGAVYFGGDGTNDTYTNLGMGSAPVNFDFETSTTGEAATDFASNEINFKRIEVLTDQIYKPLTALAASTFETDHVL